MIQQITQNKVVKNNTMSQNYEDEKVVLESNAVNPFKDWSDWYGTDGEAVVTFRTIQHDLYEEWSRQCVRIEGGEYVEQEDGSKVYDGDNAERIVEHEKFDASEVKAPGVYSDGTNYDEEDKVDESYSIIVPYPFLSPKLCQKWIEKLNEKFDREFELYIDDQQRKAAAGLDATGVKAMKISGDVKEKSNEGENQ